MRVTFFDKHWEPPCAKLEISGIEVTLGCYDYRAMSILLLGNTAKFHRCCYSGANELRETDGCPVNERQYIL